MTNTENTTAGLILSVLRNAEFSDCTLGGITSRSRRVTLVGTLDCTEYAAGFVYPVPPAMRVVSPRADAPAVALEIRKRAFREAADGEHGKIVHLTPVHWNENAGSYVRTHAWSMSGGSYATTSDSRLSQLLEDVLGHSYGALSVHDRVETY